MISDDIICLRKPEKSDLEQTWKWIQQPDVYWSIGIKVPVSKTDQQAWLDSRDRTRQKIVFAVCLWENDRLLGIVSIDHINVRHQTARISIFIAYWPASCNRQNTDRTFSRA